jgi:hypothetical protein
MLRGLPVAPYYNGIVLERLNKGMKELCEYSRYVATNQTERLPNTSPQLYR